MYSQREKEVVTGLIDNAILIDTQFYTNKTGVAQYHQVTERTVNNWLTSGKLDGVNAFGKWLIRVRDVLKFKSTD